MNKNLWLLFLWLLTFITLNPSVRGVTEAQVEHDVAVTSVTPFQTIVKLGELVNVTVVVENQGESSETFDVALYHDDAVIETKTVQNLAAGLSLNLTFTWNTTDVREQVYAETKKEKTFILNATASPVPGETLTADNTRTTPTGVRVIAHYVTVIPQSTVNLALTPGENYTVSIYTDYNGSDVWGWEFSLTYNPLVLHGVEVANGDLITKEKNPNAEFVPGEFDNAVGELSLTAAYFLYMPPEEPPTTSGPGTLANVTFTVVGVGDTHITLVEWDPEGTVTSLRNPTEAIIDYELPWFGHLLPGYFRNIEVVIHDIAILSVTPNPTSVVEGELVNITVVVENQGTVPETFDVEVWYDYHPLGTPLYRLIGTENASNLAAGATKTLTFTWDTTGVTAGEHAITVVAESLPGETDTEDNLLQSEEMVAVEARSPTPIPVTEIVIVVVATVAVIVVVRFAVGRRRKPVSELSVSSARFKLAEFLKTFSPARGNEGRGVVVSWG